MDKLSCEELEQRVKDLEQENFGLVEKITDLKGQKDRLSMSEERLKLALTGANDGIWDWDLKNGTVHFDAQYYTMAGYAPYEFQSSYEAWEKMVHADDIGRVKESLKRYLSSEIDSYNQEFRFLNKNGEYQWIWAKGKIVSYDENNRPARFVGTHSDINEYKLMGKARDDAYAIINGSPLVVVIWKNEHGWPVEFVTENIKNVFGYQSDELLSNLIRYDRMIYPDDLERIEQEVITHSADKKCESFIHKPYRILTKSGSIRWVDDRTYIKRNETGEITHYQGLLLDITDRVQAENAQLETNRMLRLILDTIPVRVFWKDRESIYLGANQAFTNDTGLASPNALIGKTDYDFAFAAQAELFRQDDSQVMNSGESKLFYEEPQDRPDGSTKWLSTSKVPIRDDQGNILGILGAYQDITERKRTDEALKASEKKYQSLFQNAQVALYRIRLSDSKILEINERYATMAGYSNLEDCMAEFTPVEAWVDPNGPKEFLKSLQKNGTVSDYETEIVLGDGTHIWTSSSATIFPEQGFLEGSIVDITERKRAEEKRSEVEAQLQQTQKMEAIGTLAGGIAHDFNNILSGIFGYSQLAKIHIKNPEKANKHIEQIVKGAQRATDLTRQILTFSRQSEYQKQPFKIYLEINEALKLLRSSIPSTIEMKSKLDSKKMALADPIKIHQIIMNLCTNAYHAMRETGGCLTVLLTDVEIFESSFLKDKKRISGEYIKLEVSDTGHGMDKKTLKRAFDPYFTTKKKGDGTGLGLALVQAIVEEHDGFLEVNSTLEKGTSFYLYFPIVREKIQESLPKTEDVSQLMGNEYIMIVDDEGPIRESYKEFIEDYGYRVQTFSNGIEAFEGFKTNPSKFDFIITDMTMPGLTGDNLASEILKINPDIPIVLCTGFSENITQAEAFELGIKQFLQKPILHQDLLILIREILDKK